MAFFGGSGECTRSHTHALSVSLTSQNKFVLLAYNQDWSSASECRPLNVDIYMLSKYLCSHNLLFCQCVQLSQLPR